MKYQQGNVLFNEKGPALAEYVKMTAETCNYEQLRRNEGVEHHETFEKELSRNGHALGNEWAEFTTKSFVQVEGPHEVYSEIGDLCW